MPSNLEKIKREESAKNIPMSQVFHVPSNLVKVKREEATKKFLPRTSQGDSKASQGPKYVIEGGRDVPSQTHGVLCYNIYTVQ